MKTINHTQGQAAANIIFFGITLSIFTLSIYFSITHQSHDLRLNVDGSSLWKYRTEAPALSEHITEVNPIDLKHFLTETTEEPLAIEQWMTDASWTTATSTFEYINAEYQEAEIPLESWMLSTESWNVLPDTEMTEAEIPLESWMLSTESWSLLNTMELLDENNYTEAEIPLESWMVNLNEWNMTLSENYTEAPIELQDWMVSTTTWSAIEALNNNYTEADLSLENWMVNLDEWKIDHHELATNK